MASTPGSFAPQLRAQLRGEIERGVVYPLPLFMGKTGLGRKAVAKLRRDGMPVRRAGRNSFILGDDFHDALARNTQRA
jgi:hypothetical protein